MRGCVCQPPASWLPYVRLPRSISPASLRADPSWPICRGWPVVAGLSWLACRGWSGLLVRFGRRLACRVTRAMQAGQGLNPWRRLSRATGPCRPLANRCGPMSGHTSPVCSYPFRTRFVPPGYLPGQPITLCVQSHPHRGDMHRSGDPYSPRSADIGYFGGMTPSLAHREWLLSITTGGSTRWNGARPECRPVAGRRSGAGVGTYQPRLSGPSRS